MSILNRIVSRKFEELAEIPDEDMLLRDLDDRRTNDRIFSMIEQRSFLQTITDADGVVLIAELKKASPSKGLIREDFEPISIADAYKRGGAQLLSVLTDEEFFQGSLKNLEITSATSGLPCLRKDFIIDIKQILQAKIAGASAILLIAAILSDDQIKYLSDYAHKLGLDVLLEVHDEAELERALNTNLKLIGINNRDLNTFETNIDTSINLLADYRRDLLSRFVITESGISTADDIRKLYSAGAKAFLIGESLIRQANIEEATRLLLS
jgi:indole-3-glycerol phosphate synthase